MGSLRGIICCFALAFLPSVAAQSAEPPITSLVFTPDHHSVLAGSQAGVTVYSWPELEFKKRFEVGLLNVHSLLFSSDEKHLAIAGGNPSENVEVFEWPTMRFLSRIGDHQDSVSDVCWSDQSVLITAGLDRSIKAWSFPDESSSRKFHGHSKSVTAVCLMNDGETLVSAGVDQSVRVWNLNTGELSRSLNQHTGPINALALRPPVGGLPMVASAAADRTIRIWQPTIGRMVRYARLESEALGLVWLSDGEHIAASCSDGKLRLVDAIRVTVLKELDGIKGWAYAIAIHPIDGSLVLAGSNGQLKAYSAEDILNGM